MREGYDGSDIHVDLIDTRYRVADLARRLPGVNAGVEADAGKAEIGKRAEAHTPRGSAARPPQQAKSYSVAVVKGIRLAWHVQFPM